jgi:hypothetical protein
VAAQGWAYTRFRKALDRGNVTEALSAAGELQFVGLAEALELTLLLADGDQDKYERAAVRWHVRFLQETKNVDLRESLAVLVLLAAIPANRLAPPPSPSSSAGDDPANESPKNLSAGRGRLRANGDGSLSRRSGRARLASCSPRRGAEVGPADTSAKPGSQYWIVGHGGWQLHPRKSGSNPPKRPKISRRLRRILTPWSSTPSSATRSSKFLSSSKRASRLRRCSDVCSWTSRTGETVLRVEPIELVTGGEN